MTEITKKVLKEIVSHVDFTDKDIFYNGLCSKIIDKEMSFENIVILYTEIIESLKSVNLEEISNSVCCLWWNIEQEDVHSPILSTFNRLTLKEQFEKIAWMQETFIPDFWTEKMISLLPNLRFPSNRQDFEVLVNPIVLFEVLKTFKENDETTGTEWAAYYMVQLTKALRLALLNNPS